MSTRSSLLYSIMNMSAGNVSCEDVKGMILQQSLQAFRMDAPEGNAEIVGGLLSAYVNLSRDDEGESPDTVDPANVEALYRQFYEAEWKRYGGELHPEEGFMPFEELPLAGWPPNLLRQAAELNAAHDLHMKREMREFAEGRNRTALG